MAQRLFLDGIDLQRGGRAVAQAVEFSVAIHADEAEAGLSGMDVAVARAKVAVNFPPGSDSHHRASWSVSAFWRTFSSAIGPPLFQYTSPKRRGHICGSAAGEFIPPPNPRR